MTASRVRKSGRKWIIGLIVFLWGCIILCGYIVYSIITINNYNELSSSIDKILLKSNKSTIAAKEFLLNAYTDQEFAEKGTSESYRNFKSALDSVIFLTRSFEKSWYIDDKIKETQITSLDNSLTSYNATFDKIAALFKEKGFKDLGLEGKMRASIHFIEKNESSIDMKLMLTLRRHEKDFLLRKHLSYIKKFEDDLEKFRDHIIHNQLIVPEFQRSDLLAALSNYRVMFLQIVEIEKQIGLAPGEGLRNNLTTELHNIEQVLNKFNDDIKIAKRRATYGINFIIGAIIIVFALIIFGVFYSLSYFKNEVTKPIDVINEAAEQIANGNLSVNLEHLKSKKLMGDLVNSFELLIAKMKLTIGQIEQISSRQIKDVFELNNDKDDIGKSLNQIITELREIDSEEKKRKWTTEGLARFGDIIRAEFTLEKLCDAVTVELVKYLKANQAGLFIVNEKSGTVKLELKASYAYDRKKYWQKEIEPGEGLTGQCFYEKDVIYMTAVPDNYMNISSGLGGANPRALLIVPFILNEKVEALFEVASFHEFMPHEILFVQKIGEIMAASLSAVRSNQKTEMLLEESQLQSQQMRAQEEEMRQNMEELLATQEEVARKEQEYQAQIELLRSEVAGLKATSYIHTKEKSHLTLSIN